MKFFNFPSINDLLGRKLARVRKKKVVKRRPYKVHLKTQGALYDLQSIYTTINQSYFEGKLDLKITWFGNAERKARRHRKLGLYCFSDKLIKIHRLLDQPNFPPYFISYVVYHEMLHSVYPPVKARRGRYSIHHANFKLKEREFAEYAAAKRWEEENKKIFFS